MAQQARSEETRRLILKAAEECFARHGYDATGLAEICRQAGVSKGAFYHHFPSKQAVFLVLLDRWLGSLDVQMAALVAAAENPADGLLALARLTAHIFRDGRDRLPIFLEFWTRATHDVQVWEATVAILQRYHQFFAGLVRQGIEQGSLRQVDPDAAARLMVSMGIGLVVQGLVSAGGADWTNAAEESTRLILEGLARRAD